MIHLRTWVNKGMACLTLPLWPLTLFQEVLLPAEQCVHDSIAKALKVIENCTEKLKVPSPTVKKVFSMSIIWTCQ